MKHSGIIARPPVKWVLVADGRTAQIYMPKAVERRIPMAGGSHRHSEAAHEVELAPVLARPLAAESLESYQTGRNQTGMVFESFSPARHMGEPHLDARREIKRRFAGRIAHFLNMAKDGKAFDRLILVAPPEMLGEIESRLGKKIQRKVTARLPKELTHLNAQALNEHLQGVV